MVLLAKLHHYSQFCFKVHLEKPYRLGSWSLGTIRIYKPCNTTSLSDPALRKPKPRLQDQILYEMTDYCVVAHTSREKPPQRALLCWGHSGLLLPCPRGNSPTIQLCKNLHRSLPEFVC